MKLQQNKNSIKGKEMKKLVLLLSLSATLSFADVLHEMCCELAIAQSHNPNSQGSFSDEEFRALVNKCPDLSYNFAQLCKAEQSRQMYRQYGF